MKQLSINRSSLVIILSLLLVFAVVVGGGIGQRPDSAWQPSLNSQLIDNQDQPNEANQSSLEQTLPQEEPLEEPVAQTVILPSIAQTALDATYSELASSTFAKNQEISINHPSAWSIKPGTQSNDFTHTTEFTFSEAGQEYSFFIERTPHSAWGYQVFDSQISLGGRNYTKKIFKDPDGTIAFISYILNDPGQAPLISFTGFIPAEVSGYDKLYQRIAASLIVQ